MLELWTGLNYSWLECEWFIIVFHPSIILPSNSENLDNPCENLCELFITRLDKLFYNSSFREFRIQWNYNFVRLFHLFFPLVFIWNRSEILYRESNIFSIYLNALFLYPFIQRRSSRNLHLQSTISRSNYTTPPALSIHSSLKTDRTKFNFLRTFASSLSLKRKNWTSNLILVDAKYRNWKILILESLLFEIVLILFYSSYQSLSKFVRSSSP